MRYQISILDSERNPIDTQDLCDDLVELVQIPLYINHDECDGEEDWPDYNPDALVSFQVFLVKTKVLEFSIFDSKLDKVIGVSRVGKIYEPGETMGIVKSSIYRMLHDSMHIAGVSYHKESK